MHYRVLINDTVKHYLLQAGAERRRELRKAFEFLESGLWEGSLRVKKLRGTPKKTVLEGRLNQSDRLLFTLGERNAGHARTIHVWGLVPHDAVDRAARAIVPANAPFLQFEPLSALETADPDFDGFEADCFTQEDVHAPSRLESGQQRWFVLDERQWRRLLLYEKGDFEIFLYLTAEQEKLLTGDLPLLVSGTAGSGKSTLVIYYLLRPDLAGKSKLFLTYNRHLRNFCERLYRALSAVTETEDSQPPLFLTFADLCRRLVPDVERRFPRENEVDVFSFQQLFRRHARAERFDYALVWEEIRSIIKGAKPQINLDRFHALVGALRKHGPQQGALQELREELLAMRLLSVGQPVGRILEKQFHANLEKVALQLEELAEKDFRTLLRALETAEGRLRGRDPDSGAALMAPAEYEQLGRKRAPNFSHSRQDLYAIAAWYQEQLRDLGLWDEIDLTRAALQALEKKGEPRFDCVACDEIQDLSDVQLSLLFRVSRDPRRLLLAGDPRQIVNPSGFRWEEVRQMFYNRRLPVPAVHHLTLNFRCAGSIVLLANALLALKQRLLGVQSDERCDQWNYQGRLPTLIVGLSPQALLEEVQITGADRIILTRTEQERDFLKNRLETELVMTIREAKGLEFGTVLLWKFASGAEEAWGKILQDEGRRLHDALIRHELNLLYVGLTRARHNLLLYDGPEPSLIWNDAALKDYVLHTDDIGYLTESWQLPSSREDWKRQGDYYQEREHHRAAAECYRNAEETALMRRCLALAAEKARDFARAGEQWMLLEEWARAAAAYEQAQEFKKARELWLKAGDAGASTRCHLLALEAEGKYDEVAEHWESEGELKKALSCWERARRPDRAAPLLEKQGKKAAAARAYQEAGDWVRAALLYEKSKMYNQAAPCYEKAERWDEAVRLWSKLKRHDDALRCVHKQGDPLRLAEFFEARGDWDNAFQSYRRVWSETLQTRFERDLDSGAVRLSARRALRLTLLGRHEQAAPLWEKARQFRLAAAGYRQAGHSYDAARCLEKAGQWMEAIRGYLDGASRQSHTSLSRCLARAVDAGGVKIKRELESLAATLQARESFESASRIYEALRNRDEASVCAALAGDFRRAAQLSSRQIDFYRASEKFLRYRRYREGAEFFRAHRWTSYYLDEEVLDCYERLLEAWLQESGGSAEVHEEIAQHVIAKAYSFTSEFVFKVLEPLGYYDQIYTSQSYRYHADSGAGKRKARAAAEARRLESEGSLAAAGLRYLLLEDAEAAQRCWSAVPVNPRNVACKEKAGFWSEVFHHLKDRQHYLDAARLAARHERTDLAREMILQSNDLLEGARILEFYEYPAEALDLYTQVGDRKKCAQLLERLKRYEDAARLWGELGQEARRQKCLNRLARRQPRPSQQQLF